ncbi:MAG: TIGR00282 family metallophosphoesterase [Candidatus Omnitrophica bacterium]|nr:TIGR00282 family metallophosphoesterase [Candidatus Omnitrophota bacterium]
MNILCLGDIVGKAGRKVMDECLADIKKEYAVDFVIANAENAAGGSGLTPKIAKQLFRLGCDVLTLGDHVWDRPELVETLNDQKNILRPENFPEGTPGVGWDIAETSKGQKVGVINLLGRVFMRYNIDCPFRAVEKIVKEMHKKTNIIVVDFHAEATSEKIAFGLFSDGKVSAVVGSHTHIQTADEQILPEGTAYITDLGMTGPYDSVIGQKKEKIIQRFLTSIPVRFEVAKGDPALCGVVVEVDDKTGKAHKVTRIQRRSE